VADYVITAERLRFIMERWLADPEFAERMAKVPASRIPTSADIRRTRTARSVPTTTCRW